MHFGLLSRKAKFDGDDTEYIEAEQNEYPHSIYSNQINWDLHQGV